MIKLSIQWVNSKVQTDHNTHISTTHNGHNDLNNLQTLWWMCLYWIFSMLLPHSCQSCWHPQVLCTWARTEHQPATHTHTHTHTHTITIIHNTVRTIFSVQSDTHHIPHVHALHTLTHMHFTHTHTHHTYKLHTLHTPHTYIYTPHTHNTHTHQED